MSSERHNLGGDKGVSAFIADASGVVESRTVEKSSQVEGGKSVENNDLVGSVGVDALVEWEVGWVAVEGSVKSGGGVRVGVGETSNPFLKETLTLGGRDRRTWAVVVVEGLFSVSCFGVEAIVSLFLQGQSSTRSSQSPERRTDRRRPSSQERQSRNCRAATWQWHPCK